MQAALSKVPTLQNLAVGLNPARATFAFDAEKVPLQHLMQAVKDAGSSYSGKLALQQTSWPTPPEKTEALSNALRKVEGVRSAGSPDERGVRVLTFDLKKRTLLKAVLDAAEAAGVPLKNPDPPKGAG